MYSLSLSLSLILILIQSLASFRGIIRSTVPCVILLLRHVDSRRIHSVEDEKVWLIAQSSIELLPMPRGRIRIIRIDSAWRRDRAPQDRA